MGPKQSTAANNNRPEPSQAEITQWHSRYPSLRREHIVRTLSTYQDNPQRQTALNRLSESLRLQHGATAASHQQQQQQQQQQQHPNHPLAPPAAVDAARVAAVAASAQASGASAEEQHKMMQDWLDRERQIRTNQLQQQQHLQAQQQDSTARQQRRAHGQCVACGQRPANPGYSHCQQCFETRRNITACTRCQQRAPNPGHELCQSCFESVRSASRNSGSNLHEQQQHHSQRQQLTPEQENQQVEMWSGMFPQLQRPEVIRALVRRLRSEGEILDALTALANGGDADQVTEAVMVSRRQEQEQLMNQMRAQDQYNTMRAARHAILQPFVMMFPNLDHEVIVSVVMAAKTERKIIEQLTDISGQQPAAVPQEILDAAKTARATLDQQQRERGAASSPSPPPPSASSSSTPQRGAANSNSRPRINVTPPPEPSAPSSPPPRLTPQDLELEKRLLNNSFTSQSRSSGQDDDDDDGDGSPLYHGGGSRDRSGSRSSGGGKRQSSMSDVEDRGKKPSSPAGDADADGGGGEDAECVVCMNARASEIMVPCGCKTLCSTCAAQGLVKRGQPCFMCRINVDGIIHATN